MANFSVSANTPTEGSALVLTFNRTDESTWNQDLEINVTAHNFGPGAADYAYDYANINLKPYGETVIIPAGYYQQTLAIPTYRDGVYEGTETIDLNLSNRVGGALPTSQTRFTLLDADSAPPVIQDQYLTVKMLDANIEVTEGQTAVIRMAISGNERGGTFTLMPDTLGNQINPGTDFTNSNPQWAAYTVNLAPGQTYAEFRMNMLDDTLRENDKTNRFGNINENYASYVNQGNQTYVRVEGITNVTLRDNDWGTPSSATAPVNINGSNNTVNIYNDNRSYVNSFNVSNTLNQTYVNSFNGTSGKDTLTGTAQNDQIAGGNGNDVLKGAQGADSVIGGGGTDQLFGGLGANVLNGGAGKDIYNVASERDAAAADILQGLTRQDRIVILGGNNLTFQQMNDGVGIFNNGTLQALAQGTLGLDTVRQMTTLA